MLFVRDYFVWMEKIYHLFCSFHAYLMDVVMDSVDEFFLSRGGGGRGRHMSQKISFTSALEWKVYFRLWILHDFFFP